ncbi:MAG TPA: type I restriction endonuclease, partial [Rhodocyclaceae bacterium]|nr:type I restriction endonuclease [Rhodocyclaceae bacterium]
MSEADIEQALLAQLGGLGYAVASDEVVGPDGSAPERDSHDVVLLKKRLEDAVLRLNPNLPAEARADAIRKLTQSVFPALLEENRRIHVLLTEGVDVEYYGEDGVLTA